MERKRGQKAPPAAAAVEATSKTKRKRKRKRERRRAKKSPQLCDDGDDEDELLISPPPSNLPRRRRRDVRITPAKIPTIPAPVWPEYLYSYDDDGGDSARNRTIFAPAASNLNFGLVTHCGVQPEKNRGEKRRRRRTRKGRGLFGTCCSAPLTDVEERCTLLGQVLLEAN